MRNLKCVLLMLALTAGALFGQAKPRLAILPFTGGTGGDGETIAALFSYERELYNVFEIVNRTSSVEAIMREQQFQRSSGLTDSDTIARLGKQYRADYVVAGHIQTLGTSKLVLITIIHVESLRQIAGDYREYREIEEIQPLIPDMAKRIAAASRTSGASLPKLAVLPFTVPAGVNQGDAEVLAQLLAVEVANSGKYAVLPRTSTIESVMTLHKIEKPALTEMDNIKVIGEALNSRYVLAGNVRSLGRSNLFTAEILNIETAGQVSGGGENYQAIGDGLAVMASLGIKLTGGAPAGDAPDNMARVEGGTFLMGSANGEDDERPVHEVTVKSFYIGKYEVTQKEWVEVMGNNPSDWEGDDLPVETVNWYEAVEFCNKLSVKEGLAPVYRESRDSITCDFSASGYRLPTEAEWEYAARGANRDGISYEYSGSNSADSVAWYVGNNGTHPVGTKQPNSLGIYDMSGNVWEWCWDWYGNYSGGAQSNPTGASSGSYRVVRGGSWLNSASFVRSAYRSYFNPSYRVYYLGFRVARSASP